MDIQVYATIQRGAPKTGDGFCCLGPWTTNATNSTDARSTAPQSAPADDIRGPLDSASGKNRACPGASWSIPMRQAYSVCTSVASACTASPLVFSTPNRCRQFNLQRRKPLLPLDEHGHQPLATGHSYCCRVTTNSAIRTRQSLAVEPGSGASRATALRINSQALRRA